MYLHASDWGIHFLPEQAEYFLMCDSVLNDPGCAQWRVQADLQNGKRMERALKVCSVLASVSLDVLYHSAETA